MTFTIESLGCAKNQVDSEQLIAELERSGLRWVAEAEGAEAVIVNSCGFITGAKEESIQAALGLKERYPGKKVILAGCLVQRYGAELAQALGELDGFVGLLDPEGIRRLLQPAAPGRQGRPEPGAERVASGAERGQLLARRVPSGAERGQQLARRERLLSYPGSAYLKIAEGCDNRCSYCAIPLIRGPLASRSRAEILGEAEDLLARGVRELILIAQDLGSFGMDRGAGELPALLSDLTRIGGEFWVRLLYIHPDHFPEEILELAADDPRLLPYFDLPFQHASPQVLSRMGRRGSAEAYLTLIRRIRDRLPEAVLRSTFLAGFPGESEEDFLRLLDFQQAAALDWVGVFAYSREEGTPAYAYRGLVSNRLAEERKAQVEQAQVPITRARLERHVGRTLPVLIEEPVRGEPLSLGRAYLQAPEVDGLVVVREGDLRPGSLQRVRIEGLAGIDLEGCLVRG
jgi:ribosomal protein S12 methylthiotransferase